MSVGRSARKLAAILAADVVGYSRLMGADEEGTLAQLRGHRRALIDPKIKEHHGRIVKTTGDGMLVEFASVVDAVRCAVEVQRGMAERNAGVPQDKRIEFRVGINLGDIIVEDKDIFGDGVNVAARLEALAEPGGICVSRGVRDPVRDKLGFTFEDIGEQAVKNIARPIHAYRVRFEGVEFGTAPSTAAPRHRRQAAFAAVGLALLVVVGGATWLVTRPATAPLTAGIPGLSIVVLPFANLSGDPGQEYFADVVTENVTTDISRLPTSFVIARNTAFTYKGKAVDVKQIARDLGVRYVLEGSVQRTGDRVRVNVQLLDGETGSHVWAERFDHERADLAEMEDEISVRLARTLSLQLYQAEAARSARKQAANPDSADLSMRGLALLKPQRSAQSNEDAFRLFEQALQLDGRNVEALVGLAGKYVYFRSGAEDTDKDIRRADELVTRALAIDPGNFWAHQSKGQVLELRRRFDEAIIEEETSLALNPSNSTAYLILGQISFYMGLPEKAIGSFEKLIRLSPRDPEIPSVSHWMAVAYFMLGEIDRVIEWERKSRAASPNFGADSRGYLAAAYALAGRDGEARAALAESLKLGPGKTIAAWRNSEFSDNPRYLAARGRLYDGLRKAGLPEE